MKKLHVNTREIGSVRVFDLVGYPTQDSLEEAAWSIQRKIRRHRLQRVILNLQMLPSLEPLGLRKLLAACIRPQRSLIFGANKPISEVLEGTYLPRNVRVCESEKEVAEDFGPFLMEKDNRVGALKPGEEPTQEQLIGSDLDRRRSKRMHVALPIDLKIHQPGKETFSSRAIATNISEGGLFAEYLNLETSEKIELLDPIEGLKVDIVIFPSANFPEEYHLSAKIVRKDLKGKQLGLAFEFLQS